MSDATVWQGAENVTIQAASSITTLQLLQCIACGALLTSSSLWKHEMWHRELSGEPRRFLDPGVEEILGHIDALYIFMGEDPPYNVGAPET